MAHNSLTLVLCAAGIGLVTSLLSGLAPMLQIVRSFQQLRLAEHGKSSTASASRQRFRGILVGSEIALAFLLVAGAGLFLSSLKRLEDVDPGFRSGGVLTGDVTLDATTYHNQAEKGARFIENVTSRLGQQSGVIAAAAVNPMPFGGENISGSFEIQDRPTPRGEPGPHTDKRWATSEYLRALQIPLLRGRWITEQDRVGKPLVAVIDDTLAKAYWPGEDPVGRRIRFGTGADAPWEEIVGVVAHVRKDSLERDENKGVVYLSMLQDRVGDATFVIRTAGRPEGADAMLQEAVRLADSNEAVYDVRSLESMVGNSLAARRLLVWLLTLFGAPGIAACRDWALRIAELYGDGTDVGDRNSDGAWCTALAGGAADSAPVDHHDGLRLDRWTWDDDGSTADSGAQLCRDRCRDGRFFAIGRSESDCGCSSRIRDTGQSFGEC